jgi:hypothetical protein
VTDLDNVDEVGERQTAPHSGSRVYGLGSVTDLDNVDEAGEDKERLVLAQR